MFKKILKLGINGFERITKELRATYEEAYGCEDLARELYIEAEARKRINKIQTMDFIRDKLQMKNLKEKGYLLTEEALEIEAEEAFERGKEQGAIDILNRLVD